RLAVRGAGAESARAQHPSGHLARPWTAALPGVTGRSVHRTDAARRLLPRPARLHALPLPQHGAALAVPALSRLEYVRRRTYRPGAGHYGSRSLTKACATTAAERSALSSGRSRRRYRLCV